MSGKVPWLDTSQLTPEALEVFGRVGLENIKVESMIGYMSATWLDAGLLGVLFVLSFSWTQYTNRENKVIRALVYWLVLSSMFLTALVHGLIMNTFAVHFGEYKTFLQPAWYKFLAIGGTLVKVPAALYFLWRAYVLIGRKKWILILVLPQILLCLVSGLVLIKVFTIPYRDDVRIVIASVSACEVLSDLIVTATIGIQLYRNRTGFAATDRLITKLLFLLAETATPPTISALIVLFFYALLPNSPTQMALTYHSKVNAICVLVSLLGKFRIADAYRAEPITLGTAGSGAASRGTAGTGSSNTAVSYGFAPHHALDKKVSGVGQVESQVLPGQHWSDKQGDRALNGTMGLSRVVQGKMDGVADGGAHRPTSEVGTGSEVHLLRKSQQRLSGGGDYMA